MKIETRYFNGFVTLLFDDINVTVVQRCSNSSLESRIGSLAWAAAKVVRQDSCCAGNQAPVGEIAD